MNTYIFDTNIVLGYLRDAPYARYVDQRFTPLALPNVSTISIVTVGELRSLALQKQWGKTKIELLHDLTKKLPTVDINHDTIIDRYAEIDAYSLSRLTTKPLPQGVTAHPMGKNDLWIAATGSVMNATLLTTDHDFDHLNGEYLQVIFIDPTTQV